jgi:hypothetical protein
MLQERLGLPGLIGAGLMLFCIFFQISVIAPAQATLAALQDKQAERTLMAGTSSVAAGSGAPLLPFNEAPAVLTQLNALAEQHGAVIERTAYQLRDGDGVRRLDVSMPVKAAYPALRGFLRDALALKAAASLEELSLQRSLATDPLLQAQVHLAFRFAATP